MSGEARPGGPTGEVPASLRTGTWRQQAACRGYDAELWFPDGRGRGGDGATAAQALHVCWLECPVRRECLLTALALEAERDGRRYGIYGGYTEADRELLQLRLDVMRGDRG